MKVSELIEILKIMPQDLEVFGPSDDSDYDYQPVTTVFVEKDSILVDEVESEEEFPKSDICVISVRG